MWAFFNSLCDAVANVFGSSVGKSPVLTPLCGSGCRLHSSAFDSGILHSFKKVHSDVGLFLHLFATKAQSREEKTRTLKTYTLVLRLMLQAFLPPRP
jgi:hypothetical protein